MDKIGYLGGKTSFYFNDSCKHLHYAIVCIKKVKNVNKYALPCANDFTIIAILLKII